MRVIGTAGHVDHGKSTLVQALTGVHPDRLKEEREREMTIDLGFAFLTLPNGEEVGIVDVPGHRDFIENMLSGVGGIDAAIFVVAADEGVMPQTREHLAILDLLDIDGGVVALTKTDLIRDEEWLDLIEEELSAVFKGTILESAPIVRVSARGHQGIENLTSAVQQCLQDRPVRPDLGRPRLPVDRVFSIAGFGTVVTGTLTDGGLDIGDDVLVLPAEIKGRIRGLQSHNREERHAAPGSRTAVNISGVNQSQVARGSWIVRPGQYTTTRRVDLKLRCLADISQAITHNTEVKLFLGAAEIVGRLRLLGCDELKAGETGWVQLELREPVVAMRNDRYIIRRPSPGETIGGGVVIDPHPKNRHRRFNKKVLAHLESLDRGSPIDIVLQFILNRGTLLESELKNKTGLPESDLITSLKELIAVGSVVVFENAPQKSDRLICSMNYIQNFTSSVAKITSNYHQQYPLRRGIAREELKSKLRIENKSFNLLLNHITMSDLFSTDGVRFWLSSHEIKYNPAEEAAIRGVMQKFRNSPYAPPSTKEILSDVSQEVYNSLLEQGVLIQVSSEVVFLKTDYQVMVETVKRKILESGGITVGDFRDYFTTTRRYALGLLEHLDEIGVTVRSGDSRRLKST